MHLKISLIRSALLITAAAVLGMSLFASAQTGGGCGSGPGGCGCNGGKVSCCILPSGSTCLESTVE